MRWLDGLEGPIRAGAEDDRGGSNAGYIVTGRGALLVDAFSSPRDGQALFAAAEAAAGRVAGLVYTHEHGDHVFGSTGFPDLPVLASRDVATGLGAELGRLAELCARYHLAPLRPSFEFERRLTLPWEPEVSVIELGGHAAGSTVVWVASAKVLFAGDLVFAGLPAWVGDGGLDRWLASLDEVETWGAACVVPGHGSIGGPEVLTVQRERLRRFASRLRELRAAGTTAASAATRLAVEFDLNEANGYDASILSQLETALRERFGFGV